MPSLVSVIPFTVKLFFVGSVTLSEAGTADRLLRSLMSDDRT